jgi:small GTP-binding protein
MAEDLARLARVSKRFYALVTDHRLWTPLYLRHFAFHRHHLQADDTRFYEHFRECARKEKEMDIHKPATTTDRLWSLLAADTKKPAPDSFTCDYSLSTHNRDMNLLLLGMSAAGKTSLVQRMLFGKFDANEPETMGASFLNRKLLVEEQLLSISCWDLSGSERNSQMLPMYFRGANVALIVFSLALKDSFARAKGLVKELRSHPNTSKSIRIAVVATKHDMRHVVDAAAAKQFADDSGVMYAECSAATGAGVQELLLQLVRDFRKCYPPAVLP